MATNKDKTYQYIQQRYFKGKQRDLAQGVDTEGIATYLQIKRPNASALLNQLVKEGLLDKTKTRPVHYNLSSKVAHDAFSNLIGVDGSLTEAVKQAKAAVRFPGGILPIQIIAAPGSGTTYFSKAIIQYAKDKKILSKRAAYHEINCIVAPDLNRSLFGKNGQDNFLNRYRDSVIMVNHYEKLNSAQVYQINHLLDETPNPGHNLIMFSTVPTNKDQIKTAIRITLPSFNQRPLAEKLTVVQSIFAKQAKSSKKTIVVPANILLGLVMRQYKRGFKDLEKAITLASAKAYLRCLDDRQEQEFIMKNDFPDDFVFSKTLNLTQREKINDLMRHQENFVFKSNNQQDSSDYTERANQKLYTNINRHYQDLTQEGLKSDFIAKTVLNHIKYLYDKYGFHLIDAVHHKRQVDITELGKLVPVDLIKTVRQFLDQASEQLNRQFNRDIFYGLCLHLNSLINLGNQSESNLKPQELASLKMRYPGELKITRGFATKLKKQYHYTLSEAEVMLILTFLVEPRVQWGKPVILYAMHGSGAAHYLSQVTNSLNQGHNAYAYDMQLNKDMKTVYQELKNLVLKINQGGGIIAIYDMGSFKDMFERIIDETQIPIRLLNVPVTLIGLEASRKAMLSTNVDDVFNNVVANLQNYNSQQISNKQNMIITLCHTGEGGAVQLRDYINQYSHLGWLVKPMSISNRSALAQQVQQWRKIYNIKEFVGTYNPNLFGIPFISITKIFENSHQNLDKLLNFIPIDTTATIYDQIYQYYQEELKYVQVGLLKETMPQVMDQLTEQYNLSEDVQIGLFTHIVGILENGLAGKPRQKVKMRPAVASSLKVDFDYVEHCLRPLEKAFSFVFNDSDIYTIIGIMKKL